MAKVVLLPMQEGFPYDAKLFTPQLMDEVSALLLKGTKGTEVLGCWEDIKALFEKAGLGHYYDMLPEFGGVHPSNRATFGVGASESQHHGADILRLGFS